MNGIIRSHTWFNDQSTEIAPEVKVLFPQVKEIALSKMVVTPIEEISPDTVSMIFVKAPYTLTDNDRKKLLEYLRVKFKDERLGLTVNPKGFPWPSEH